MPTFYVTYGGNTNQANNYSVVEAPDYGGARAVVFRHIGDKWAFMYDEEDFKGQPERYGLTEIPLTAQVKNE